MPKRQIAHVWDAIEDTPSEAALMKARSQLMMTLTEHIRENGLTPSEAAKLLGVTQPCVSDLLRGKIDLFSTDTLVAMLASAGLPVTIRLEKAS